MRTTTLGASGPRIGVLGLGCMGMTYAYDMSTPRDDQTSISVIHRALDLGMTLLDTADLYGPHTNEELLGRALRGGHRQRAVVATKVGLVHGPDGRATNDGRPEHVRASIDASLRRLGTDHVDLYQLHRVDPAVALEETWGAMAEAVAAGKALHIGLSEVSVGEIERAQAVHPVTAVQSELSLWSREPAAAVLPHCRAHGITFLSYSPLGRGFLTGRFNASDDLPTKDFRHRLPRFQPEAVDANLRIVDRAREVGARVGATAAQVALAWLFAQGPDIVGIPGTKTPAYLAENAAALELTLGADDLADLDAAPAATGGRY